MTDRDKIVGYVIYYAEDGDAAGAFVLRGRPLTLWSTISAMKKNRPRSTVRVKSVENIPLWVTLG